MCATRNGGQKPLVRCWLVLTKPHNSTELPSVDLLDWISPIGRHTGESRAPGELPGRCGRGQETVELTPWDERPERLEWTLELRCFPSVLVGGIVVAASLGPA